MSLCPFGASVCWQIGWMEFTDAVIKVVNEQLKGVVFILWGKYVV
jgi:uracil DNA glycosylase